MEHGLTLSELQKITGHGVLTQLQRCTHISDEHVTRRSNETQNASHGRVAAGLPTVLSRQQKVRHEDADGDLGGAWAFTKQGRDLGVFPVYLLAWTAVRLPFPLHQDGCSLCRATIVAMKKGGVAPSL